MSLQRIDRMHYSYGYGPGFCQDCPHFRKECWNKKYTAKRLAGYDQNNKPIYEYESHIACGLKDRPYPEDTEQLPGQLRWNDEGGVTDGGTVY